MIARSTDIYWVASLWVSLITVGLLIMVLAMLYWLKRQRIQRLNQDQTFDAHWQNIMVAVALGERTPSSLVEVTHRSDQWRLLKLWIRMQMLLQGDARDRLRRFGEQLHLREVAFHFFQSPSRAERLMSVMCLGFLKDLSAWTELEGLLADQSHSLSLHAAWALLELDGARASQNALHILLQRQEDDLVQIAALFRPFAGLLVQAWQSYFETLLRSEHSQVNSEPVIRMLQLARALEMPLDDVQLLPLLEQNAPAEAVIAVLKLLSQPASLSRVESLANHPDWAVRAQVAQALARIGQPHAVSVLERLVCDAQWWVRYRAAQALVNLTPHTSAQWQDILITWRDRFAKDIVTQVLAEQWGHHVG